MQAPTQSTERPSITPTDPSGATIDPVNSPARSLPAITYFAIGIFFGILLTKSEMISWFRMQEMFRFDSFYMYGALGCAFAVAAGGFALIRRLGLHSLTGERIVVPPKNLGRGHRYWIGGLIFGIGWAFTGACPGPLFGQIGAGATVMVVAFASAVVGAWCYGYLRPKLPH
jgi:uncharacterized membrane protein YedE/YeeE